MTSLKEQFEAAAKEVQDLPQLTDNQKLELYGLYKQATQGNCTGSRPGYFDFVGRSKYDAWKAVEGTSSEDAMQKYVDLIAKHKSA